jgi:nicotinamide-nucleotide amidase
LHVTNEIIDLATRVGQALRARNLLLCTAESCTGGGVSQAVTDIAGSSDWFDRGFVTYSNASKSAMLDVPPALIAQMGAVSEEVAAAMAQGALANSNAHVALSTTGIAGPGGAVPGKPVGTVCFGWSRAGATRTERLVFEGDRQAVREQSVIHSLQGLLRFIG